MKTLNGLRRLAGFSVAEVMIVVLVGGILVAMAAPNFRLFLISQEIKSLSFEVFAAMTFARSEAVKRNAPVEMRAFSADNWAKGWEIRLVSDSSVLRAQGQSNRAQIVPQPGGVDVLVFSRSGRVSTGGATKLQIDDPTGSSLAVRCITIGLTGQALTKEGACT